MFAWQPLVVMEMLGAGHQDILGVLFLIAGLRRADAGNMRRAAMCLAASVAVKPLALLVLPFVIRRAWREDGRSFIRPSWRRSAGGHQAPRRLVLWFLATPLLLTPLYNAEAMAETWRAITAYSASWAGSAAVACWKRCSPGRMLDARLLRVWLAALSTCALATLVVGLIAWQRRVSPAAAFYAMIMTAAAPEPHGGTMDADLALAMVPVLWGAPGRQGQWAGTAVLSYSPETLAGRLGRDAVTGMASAGGCCGTAGAPGEPANAAVARLIEVTADLLEGLIARLSAS